MISTAPKMFVQPPAATEEEIKFREYVTALGGFCRKETFHGEYSARFQFMAEPHADDNETSGVRMDVFIDSVYLWYRVRIYPEVFDLYKDRDFKSIGVAMMHETCHLFLEPVAKLFMWDACASQEGHYRDTIERQTERICNTISYTLADGWYLPDNVFKAEAKT